MSKENFEKALQFLFPSEGGYVNDSKDPGGPTNMGVTQGTYNMYLKNRGFPPKDVKQITKGEAVDLYYKYYWKASGADNISDPNMAVALFDTAVLHGAGQARQYYKQSGGDIDKFLDIRQKHYDKRITEDSSQRKYYQGWNNRVNNLRKNIKEGTFTTVSNDINHTKNLSSYMENYNDNQDNYSIPFKIGVEYNDYFQNNLPNLNDLMIDPLNQQMPSNNPWDIIPMAVPDGFAQATGLAASLDLGNVLQIMGIGVNNQASDSQNIQKGGLFGYKNPLTGDNRIFTREEIGDMTTEEYTKNEKAIRAQWDSIGIPTDGDMRKEEMTNGGVVHVNSYTRQDGTKVKDYYRSRPSI